MPTSSGRSPRACSSCVQQHRPVLQRAHAHAGAARAARRGGGDRQGTSPRRLVVGDRHRRHRASARWSARRSSTRSRRLIGKGIDEGATLVAGGAGRPDGVSTAATTCKPTVFADVRNDMTIAREEIFGPVLVDHPLRQRRRGGRHRQRHALRPVGLRVRRATWSARGGSPAPARRHGAPQRRQADLTAPFRRLQAVGQRPRVGRASGWRNTWK